MERVSLIDVSSEDDLLIATSSEGLPNPPTSGLSGKCELNRVGSEAVSVLEEEILIKICKQMEQVPELSESPEQKQTKHGKYNLRKSLAWDNAFFTNEGVLNTEELGIVNSTFKKSEARVLPGIQEDVRKSSESTSTLDGDGWGLENLEVDLFENLRASIQKSLGKCDKASTPVHSNNAIQGELDTPRIGSSKVGPSQNKLKLPTAVRRHGIIKQRPDDTSKEEALVRVKLATSGSGDSKALLKPPRITPAAAPLPTSVPIKKASASGNVQIKINNGKGLSGNVAKRQSVVVRKTGESCSTPRSIPSPKFTSGSHLGNEVGSLGSSSDSSGKSTLDNSRKRSARYLDHPSSGSAAKTPLRTSKSKLGSGNSNDLPARLKSTFKFSSSLSPSSSADSVVSESSSSNSIAMKSSNSTESIDAAGSSISPSLPVTLVNCVPRPSDLRKLPIDRSRSCISNSSGANCSKPSGLRMPTPKIGYFDAEKSLVRSSNKFSQPSLQNSLLRNTTGISSTVTANKLKPSKLHSAKPAARNLTVNSDSPYSRTATQGTIPPSPASLRRLSKPAEHHGALRIAESHDLCSKLDKDLPPITTEVGCVKVFEVGAVVSDMAEHFQMSNLCAEEQPSQSSPKPMIAIHSGNGSAFSGEGDSDLSRKGAESIHQIGETEAHKLWLSYINEGYEQSIQNENSFPADYADGLISRHLQTEDPMVELVERGVTSLSLSETKDSNAGGDSVSPTNLIEPIAQEQKSHIPQNTSKLSSLSVLPTAADPGPNSRTPLVDRFLQ